MKLRMTIVAILLAAAALVWTAAEAQQEMRPTPGPGSGMTRVMGTVDVGNVPEVTAAQRGDWKVAINNTPTVTVGAMPALPFIRVGTRYVVTWPDGGSQRLTVTESGPGGWVKVSGETTVLWVNLSAARSIEFTR